MIELRTLRQFLSNLNRIGGGTLSEIVGHNPEIEAMSHRLVCAYAAHKDFVATGE